jgi:hypothetical protein
MGGSTSPDWLPASAAAGGLVPIGREDERLEPEREVLVALAERLVFPLYSPFQIPIR